MPPDDIVPTQEPPSPPPAAPPKAPEVPAPTPELAAVPQVTAHPEWRLSKEDWDSYQNAVEEMKSKISGVLDLAGVLSPIKDALDEVLSDETPPTEKRPFLRRKLWGNK